MREYLIRLYHHHFQGAVHAVHTTNYILFMLYEWLYLFILQRDVIQLIVQRILSMYVSGFELEVILWFLFVGLLVLCLVINHFLRLKCKYHALSFFPVFALMSFMTLWVPSFDVVGSGIWGLLLLLYVVLISRLSRGATGKDNYLTLLRTNLLIFLMCFLVVSLLGNFKDVFHYELKTERYLTLAQPDKALEVAQKELPSSIELQALRAYALAKQGKMAERLFEYPVADHQSLMINYTDAAHSLLPIDSVSSFMGFVPGQVNADSMMMAKLKVDSCTPLRDYWLCTLLLRKNLQIFVSWLPRLYNMHHPLPRYYTEALILYNSLYVHSELVYHNAQAEANYADYREMSKQYANKIVRRNYLRKSYGNTYWWYYMYD